MPKEFETKRVLVTGAASGIGQAQAIAFAEQGAEVIGIDLDETGLKQTAALVDPDSAKSFTYFVGDVSSPSFVQATMKQIVKNNGQIDILLNTAGILDDYRPSLETSEALWDQILATNLKSVFLVTNAILPYFSVHCLQTRNHRVYKTTFLRLCQIRHSSKCDCARCHPNTHERS